MAQAAGLFDAHDLIRDLIGKRKSSAVDRQVFA